MLLIRRIRELLYEQGFTINGARNRLDEGMGVGLKGGSDNTGPATIAPSPSGMDGAGDEMDMDGLRRDLLEVVALLR